MSTLEDFDKVNKICERAEEERKKLHEIYRTHSADKKVRKEAIERQYQKYIALDSECRRKTAELVRSIPS